MKKITFILLYILPYIAISQSNDTIKNNKIDIGFTYSPEYSYRRIISDNNSEIYKTIFDSLEIPKFGYSTGINGIYSINKKFAITLSFLFSDKGEKLKENSLPSYEKFKNHYYYLDIPVKVKYSFFETPNKYNFYSTLGISLNMFLNHRISYTFNGANSTQASMPGNSIDIAKTNVGINVGLGINCTLTKKWYFKGEVTYKQSLNPIVTNSNLKRYLYSFGPTLGFFYKI